MSPVRCFAWSACLMIAALAGCSSKPPAAPAAAKTGVKAAVPAAKTTPADDMLNSAVYQLQPENLGIDSDLSSAVSVLNNWRQQSPLFQPDFVGFTEAGLNTIPADWLSDAQRREVFSQEFTKADAVHIRNSLISAQMVRYATGDRKAELDRVVALFEFVMRTVALQPAALPGLPFPLYEIMLVGQGTPDDRTWVFASLLKQQRIDTVIIQSKDDPDAKLIGVILGGEVYLFDARLGLPVPRGDDPPSALITQPATLREMAAHPEWWQQLTLRADQPYPWTAEQLAAAEVFVFSAPESWNTRMRQLETVLPADSLCVLYDPVSDPFTDSAAVESLANRIAKGSPDWTPDKLRIWSHPLTLSERAEKLGPQIQQLMFVLKRFEMPFEMKFDEKKQLVSVKASLQHLKCRTEQLQGKFAQATNHYLAIRHLAVERLPAELTGNPQEAQQIGSLYALAASDATFWSAVCKIEQGERETAANAFSDYLRRYARLNGNWLSAARSLQALTLAQLDRLSDARVAISALPPDDPHRPGLEILAKRWDALTEKKPDTEPKSDSDKADADKASDEPAPEKTDP